MKWIGQHIWDFISRFRSDVYLEDVDSGTIVSGGNLGLDSNNKIVKNTVSSTTDLTSDVTGVLPVANGGTGASSLTSNRVLTGNGSSAIQAEDNLYFQHPSLIIGADDDSMSIIEKAEHSDGHGGVFKIQGAPANAGQTDKNGGDIYISAGRPTGAGTFGEIQFYGGDVEGTGTSLRTNSLISKLAGNAATSTDFYLYERAGASSDDYFKASVAANGATTLSTTDGAGTSAGTLTLDADGLINIDADRNGDVNFQDNSVTFARLNNVGSTSNLFLYEAAGASFSDYFKIATNTNGDTTISTVDTAGTDANLTLDIDGTITIDSTDGIVNFDEDTASMARIQSGLGNILEVFGNSNGSGKISLSEDTDNGTNDITIQAPIDISGNRIQQLADASGYIALTNDTSGRQFWMQTIGGYKTNNNSSTFYYFPFRGATGDNWGNSDSSISSINQYDAAAHFMIAPASGVITNIKVHGYVTGTTDPFKFYIKHSAMTNNATSISLTDMFNTSTITPSTTARTWSHTEDFSSNNTFDEDDMLFCFIKKDSTSGNSSHYFQMTISGYINV